MSNRNTPQYNNLISGFDKYSRSYIQEPATTENKYFTKNTSSVEFAPKTTELRSSMEGFKDHNDNRRFQIELEHMRRLIAEQDAKFSDFRRDMEDMTNKFLTLKTSTQNDILNLRDLVKSPADRDRTRSDPRLNYENRISELESSVNFLKEHSKKWGMLPINSKEKLTEPIGIDIEKKINELHESVRQQLKVMDVNFVEILCDKEQMIGNLSQEISLMRSNINILGDQVAKVERALSRKIDEGQLYKLIEPHLLNRTVTADVSMRQSRQSGFYDRDIDSKMRELETSFNNIALIEKDMRGKYELYDLNLNSIKKHMELDLTISLKQSIVPLQKHIESYLQGVESRIGYLEDVVTKEIRRDSFIFPSNVREQTHPRTANYNFNKSVGFSHNTRESLNFGNHLLDSQVEGKFEEQKHPENLTGSYPFAESLQIPNTQISHSPKADKLVAANLDQLQTHDSIRIEEDEVNEDVQTESNEPTESKIAKSLAPDRQHPKPVSLEKSIRSLETRNSELPLLHDMPVPTKSSGAFKMIYQEFIRNQAHEKTLKSSKEGQRIRSQGLRSENTEENQPETRKITTQQEEFSPGERGMSSIARTNQIDTTYSPDRTKNTGSNHQSKALEQKGIESSASGTKSMKDSEVDEGENFDGSIKGLLKKSRKMRESYPPKEDPNDYRQNSRYEPSGTNPLGYRQTLETKQMYDPRLNPSMGGGQYSQNLPLRSDLGRRPMAVKQDPDDPLPPLNTKGSKNFNKSDKYSRPEANRMQQNQLQRGGLNNRRDPHNRGYFDPQMDEIQEGDDVEEIVYHVNEEGYLVDEQGNFLYDEQGQYIRLSPEQMREIEENEVIYQDQEDDYYR